MVFTGRDRDRTMAVHDNSSDSDVNSLSDTFRSVEFFSTAEGGMIGGSTGSLSTRDTPGRQRKQQANNKICGSAVDSRVPFKSLNVPQLIQKAEPVAIEEPIFPPTAIGHQTEQHSRCPQSQRQDYTDAIEPSLLSPPMSVSGDSHSPSVEGKNPSQSSAGFGNIFSRIASSVASAVSKPSPALSFVPTPPVTEVRRRTRPLAPACP